MAPKKKKGADPLSFIQGYLGKPENKSAASKFVRNVNKRNKALKKLGY